MTVYNATDRASASIAMTTKQLKLVEYHNISAQPIDGSTVFRSTKTRRLYEWWTGVRRDRLPRRRDFDIVEHADLAEYLFLAQALGANRFLLKLHGEAVITMFGRNPTGYVASADDTTETFGHALHEYYRTVLDTGTPHLCLGDLSRVDRGYITFESIDCPLVDDATGEYGYIIGATEPIDEAHGH